MGTQQIHPSVWICLVVMITTVIWWVCGIVTTDTINSGNTIPTRAAFIVALEFVRNVCSLAATRHKTGMWLQGLSLTFGIAMEGALKGGHSSGMLKMILINLALLLFERIRVCCKVFCGPFDKMNRGHQY